MFAIIPDLDEIVELLLQNKANASITDDSDRTPLFIAVQYSNFDKIKIHRKIHLNKR